IVALNDSHKARGYGHLNRMWAKLEIVFGLAAAGAGLLFGTWAVSRVETEWMSAAVGWPLIVLGAYLAMAGRRSHLYQSANELTA
ncbi:hypothetical protein, partial [Streptomyces galilaeus]|uniref:hypothetical protein n=1 Tax=Streptomyces galilaeus TaxID=33899 RepID=UPI0038F62AA2